MTEQCETHERAYTNTISANVTQSILLCWVEKDSPVFSIIFDSIFSEFYMFTNSFYFFSLLLEKKGGGGDGDEGKSMSHWEYIMHDCCLRVYSLKCVPHRYLSGCHIWATLKCGDENRWNVCEHTRSFAQWKWWFYGWWWCWFRCRINICLVFHLNKWPWLW